MRTALSIIAAISWALWLGGLVSLFVFVPALFARSRALAGEAAPVLFLTFEKYQWVVGAVALLATAMWFAAERSSYLTALLVLAAVAAVGAVVSAVAITGKMEALRLAGQSGTAAFRRLHGYSMALFLGQIIALVVYGVLMPLAMRAPAGVRSPEGPFPSQHVHE